jgi:hypothetical protein
MVVAGNRQTRGVQMQKRQFMKAGKLSAQTLQDLSQNCHTLGAVVSYNTAFKKEAWASGERTSQPGLGRLLEGHEDSGVQCALNFLRGISYEERGLAHLRGAPWRSYAPLSPE